MPLVPRRLRGLINPQVADSLRTSDLNTSYIFRMKFQTIFLSALIRINPPTHSNNLSVNKYIDLCVLVWNIAHEHRSKTAFRRPSPPRPAIHQTAIRPKL